ncbi:MAG TPA: glycosyltransferase family 39 protein [Solirubrobacteraceae bacterium]|nr:glycosyltransferase family 39 protein [Solirubrobacteraceae bacterium]
MSAVAAVGPAAIGGERRLARWWPLAALIVLAAALRLATLTQQGFWYDEAFTPVHVLHAGLGATLKSVVHTENTPPLWYLLAWADARLFGDGALALRLPSALAGIATVPVVWAIGQELSGRRAALIGAALVAVNPLFVWYSQEARAYGLFVLFSALAMLCFARLLRAPSGGRAAAFAVSGALALLTHYFAVFLLAPMALWLLLDQRSRKAALPAIGALALVGLALVPLISAQGGHGTQWIGRWALSSRLQAIPQYYLTGYSGSPLGRGVELLVALPLLAGVLIGGFRLLAGPRPAPAPVPAPARSTTTAAPAAAEAPEPSREGASISFSIAAFAVLAPVALAVLGADYLAPRNLVGAMIPVSVLVAILLAAVPAPLGPLLAGAGAAGLMAVSIDVDLSPRLQRGNWRDVAKLLRHPAAAAGSASGRPVPAATTRVLTTVELGAAPLEYYLSDQRLRNLSRHASVTVSEIDATGYSPLRAGAADPPAPGFRLLERRNVDGLIVYRFVSSIPRTVSEADLRRHVITLAHPEVLVPSGARVSRADAGMGTLPVQMSSSDQNI